MIKTLACSLLKTGRKAGNHRLEGANVVGVWLNGRSSCGLDESRSTLFQSDGGLRVRRKADEEMLPSCLVSTVSACDGGAVIWSSCSRSGSGSATLCAQRVRSADNLNDRGDH